MTFGNDSNNNPETRTILGDEKLVCDPTVKDKTALTEAPPRHTSNAAELCRMHLTQICRETASPKSHNFPVQH